MIRKLFPCLFKKDSAPAPQNLEGSSNQVNQVNGGGLPTIPEPAPVPEKKKSPPWYLIALRFKGKKETDQEFSKFMVPHWWTLFKMKLGTIAENWAAWCGLAMAVALYLAGLGWQPDGSLARNWAKFGVAIEWKTHGIPQGAIVHINHNFNCAASSGNHVAQANGDCAPEDLSKKGATIDLLGGNQSNTWKVSTYDAREICAVRWPKDYEFPAKVTKSLNCTSAQQSKESTQ